MCAGHTVTVAEVTPMPRRTLGPTVCPHHGCPNLTPCPTHPPTPWAGSTRAARLPTNWKRTTKRILTRDHHRCYLCGAPATQVDHLEPGDNHDPANLAAICTTCHARKSSAEGRTARAHLDQLNHSRPTPG